MTWSAANTQNDVAENGDVAWWGTSDYAVSRWRDGANTVLTPSGGTLRNHYVLTDGVSVVYARSSLATGTAQIVANLDGVETQLTPMSDASAYPGSDFMAAGGFVAYRRRDASQLLQAWRHGPAGDVKLTSFSNRALLEAIGPDGSMVVTDVTRRYLAAPGAGLQDVGSFQGTVLWRDGRFVVLMGRAALEVVP